MKHTGCSMVQAFLMASRNPAKAIGMDHEIGTIAPGKKANLVFTDDAFRIRRVMLNGTFRL
jgi:N-acetylglucosamine-6-phosphate deacetylase